LNIFNIYGPDKQLCRSFTDLILPLSHATIMSDTCQINLDMLLASFPSSRFVRRLLSTLYINVTEGRSNVNRNVLWIYLKIQRFYYCTY